MIDRFHKDPDTWIFLISTLAGGTGLNLVGANKVVIFGEFPHPSLSPSISGLLCLITWVDPNWSEGFSSWYFEMDRKANVNRSRP